MRQQIKRHLVDYIERYQIPKIREFPTEILGLEYKIKFKKESFNFEARLDRIERRGNRLAIIDYKTSASVNYLKINFNKLDINTRDTWPKYIGSLQLPIYLLAYQSSPPPCPFPNIVVPQFIGDVVPQFIGDVVPQLIGELQKGERGNIDCMFLLLGKAEMNSNIELPLFDNPEDASEYNLLCKIIFNLLEEIITPNHPFTPTIIPDKMCPDCDFRYICSNQ